MRVHPCVITISGSRSGVGKTYLATLLIKNLPGFAAIKVTKEELLITVTDDEAEITCHGKDTALMRQAGAEKVIWIRAGERDLADALSIAFDMVYKAEAPGVIIEGNAAARVLKADISVFVTGGNLDDMKPGALEVLKKADVIIVNAASAHTGAINCAPTGLDPALESAIRAHNPAAMICPMERLINPDQEILELFCRLKSRD